MDVGIDFIGLFKTNTGGFCKGFICSTTKELPGGYYLVFKSNLVMPGDRHILAIWYNYNSRKVLSLMSTEGAESTKFGIAYLYNYP